MTIPKRSGGCCGPTPAGSGPEGGGTRDAESMREHVRKRYAAAATRGECGATADETEKAIAARCCDDARTFATGYTADDVAAIPAEADLGLGCGHPTALGGIAPGETVLDLGSGAGVDCFLAARAVGPTGKVIGVDMTPEMVARARRAGAGRFPNVDFRLGEIEHLPIGDASMDVVISNCVLNLVPDKAVAFAEIERVLKPGGRAYISDVVLLAPLPEWVRTDPDSVAACVGGALLVDDYKRTVEGAGLTIERFDLRGGGVEVALAGEDGAPAPTRDARSAAATAAQVADAALAVIRSADIVLRKAR